jgi:hypothetical protein
MKNIILIVVVLVSVLLTVNAKNCETSYACYKGKCFSKWETQTNQNKASFCFTAGSSNGYNACKTDNDCIATKCNSCASDCKTFTDLMLASG